MVKEMIKRAAKIARIKLADGESERLAVELETIFDWIGDLPRFETKLEKEYVEPRKDESTQYAGVEEIKSMFPKRRGDYCRI